MDIRLKPIRLAGTVEAVSSKSQLHRLLICALLADGETKIIFRGLSEDILATVHCIRALGKTVTVADGLITVEAGRRALLNPALDCGESGTTARLLLPVAAALTGGFTMTGCGRLPGRPMAELCLAMEGAGVSFSAHHLPLQAAGSLRAGTYRLPGNVSSQYISGLLLALPVLAGDSEIQLTTPLSSAAYVEMTRAAMRLFGVAADVGQIWGGQTYVSPGALSAEGDWSNAAPWLCFPEVTVTGLDFHSVQGDRAASELIAALRGEGDIEIEIDGTPDLLPVMAAFAAKRRGNCRFTKAARLRLKESDRLAVTAALIEAVGGAADIEEDTLTVLGKDRLAGGTIDAAGDHRMVMAAVVLAGLCDGPVTVRGCEAVNKSYPDFFKDYKALGGAVHVL
ncbi:3-phosphoshikimate 1-carboxyvinyltransferase [bioreactor metagenome]|uniref:3-phosphoshikimate 1-carboxyvinyltransferase n=1 Tax=bioreactor metagenome TaxID=1076179 RepID=A0A644YZX0_9ZZZZ